MELEDIEKHWKNWADTFGTDIRSTEKSKTRKSLEVDALIRALKIAGFSKDDTFSLVEPGCGAGHNCLAIAEHFPRASVTGFDFIPEMVENANALLQVSELKNVQFFEGDLLNLSELNLPIRTFDVVLTNRCLINLNTAELQSQVAIELAALLPIGGAMIFAENPIQKFVAQNKLRSSLNIPDRSPPEFNLLLDEETFIPALEVKGIALQYEDHFSSLHDLLLYVLLPGINGGKIDYDHPILAAASELCPKVFEDSPNSFGEYGQNKLYLFKKLS